MGETRLMVGYSIISIVSFISIISSIYVCWSIIQNGYVSCKKYNPTKHYEYKHSIMTSVIFGISVTETFIGLRCLLMFAPQIFVHPHDWFYDGYNGIICQILAIGNVFIRIQNSLLHIILAYNFLYLLRLKSLQKLLKYQQRYHYLIIIIVKLELIFLSKL